MNISCSKVCKLFCSTCNEHTYWEIFEEMESNGCLEEHYIYQCLKCGNITD